MAYFENNLTNVDHQSFRSNNAAEEAAIALGAGARALCDPLDISSTALKCLPNVQVASELGTRAVGIVVRALDRGFPNGVELTKPTDCGWGQNKDFDKCGEIGPPVPIGMEPEPRRSLIERLTGGGTNDGLFGKEDKFPREFYPIAQNAGLITLPAESQEQFNKRYPKLAEYNRRVEAEVKDEYPDMVRKYADSLDPKEREAIAKEYKEYQRKVEENARHGDWRMGFDGAYNQPEQGPHLKKYLEHVQGLKQAAHDMELAKRQAIAAELGPKFQEEARKWRSEREHNMISM